MKCIKQTLKESVTDNTLLKLGEGYFEVVATESEVKSSKSSTIKFINGETIKLRIIEGNGYFTDETFTQNLGKELNVFPIEGGTEVRIAKNTNCKIAFNKKALRIVTLFSDRFKLVSNELYGCNNLEYLDGGIQDKDFDLNDLIGCPVLDTFRMYNSKKLSFNLATFAKFPALSIIDLGIGVGKASPNIHGDIATLSNLNLNSFTISVSSVYGDISKLKFKSLASYNTHSWTERPSSYEIMSINGGVDLGSNVDKMLNDQAKCIAPTDGTTKIIDVKGTKTSESDSAISTLKAKGYTIKINGVSL